ncbi:hypothetical protein [Nocardia sp. NPDC052566]|uniref:hypothetical protein n=1 Tax=Nocardia sp. NPDC052566 TaxID=3364330 RepID=UPI0037C762FF
MKQVVTNSVAAAAIALGSVTGAAQATAATGLPLEQPVGAPMEEQPQQGTGSADAGTGSAAGFGKILSSFSGGGTGSPCTPPYFVC